MGAGLGLALLAVVSQTSCTGRLRRWGGRAVITLALILHATVAETAISLLNCRDVSLSGAALASLDATARVASTAGPGDTSLHRILLLASDPYFVCFAGQHTAAGALAGVALLVYAALFPCVALVWLWRSPWLAAQLRAEREAAAAGRGRGRKLAPLAAAAAAAPSEADRASTPPVDSDAAVVDVPFDPILSPFLDDCYVARYWYWRHIDRELWGGAGRVPEPVSRCLTPTLVPRPPHRPSQSLSCSSCRQSRAPSRTPRHSSRSRSRSSSHAPRWVSPRAFRTSLRSRPPRFSAPTPHPPLPPTSPSPHPTHLPPTSPTPLLQLTPLAVAVLVVNPYAPGHEWKKGTRAALLALSLSCAIMNAAAVRVSRRGRRDRLFVACRFPRSLLGLARRRSISVATLTRGCRRSSPSGATASLRRSP